MEKNDLMNKLKECIEACGNCISSCLKEENVDNMRECIASDIDCLDICSSALKFLSRDSSNQDVLLKACIEVCQNCEKSCREHDMDHCQKCADACKACKEACESHLALAA